MTTPANIKALGRTQRSIVKMLLVSETIFVYHWFFYDTQKHKVIVTDPDGNEYKEFNLKQFQSLVDRKIILPAEGVRPNVDTNVTRWRLNNELRK